MVNFLVSKATPKGPKSYKLSAHSILKEQAERVKSFHREEDLGTIAPINVQVKAGHPSKTKKASLKRSYLSS